MERTGSRQRSSQVSAGYLNTKTVLFSLNVQELTLVFMCICQMSFNPKPQNELNGGSQEQEMRPESHIYFWHCESLFKNICEQGGVSQGSQAQKITLDSRVCLFKELPFKTSDVFNFHLTTSNTS